MPNGCRYISCTLNFYLIIDFVFTNFHDWFFPWWQRWDHLMIATIFIGIIRHPERSWRSIYKYPHPYKGTGKCHRTLFLLLPLQADKLCLLSPFWEEGSLALLGTLCTWAMWGSADGRQTQFWYQGKSFHRLSNPSSVSSLPPCTYGCPKGDRSCCSLPKGWQEFKKDLKAQREFFCRGSSNCN